MKCHYNFLYQVYASMNHVWVHIFVLEFNSLHLALFFLSLFLVCAHNLYHTLSFAVSEWVGLRWRKHSLF